MKHSMAWWLLIGWWWYLGFAWWVYPIKWLISRKAQNSAYGADNGNRYLLIQEAERNIIAFLSASDNGTALQVDVKKHLAVQLAPYFDEAVHELYQHGKIKTSKDGGCALPQKKYTKSFRKTE